MDNTTKLLEKGGSILAQDDHPGLCRNQYTPTDAQLLETDNLLEIKLFNPVVEIVLTKREREILNFVLAGKTNKEIAQKLYRTERTVEYHRNRMMRKLGTRTTVELVKRAITMGIV